ncbi:MAG: ATP-binding protein [Candidatus Electrothrix sp.]
MSLFGEKIFPARLEALNDIREYVRAAATRTPLDKKKIYKLQLSIDEIATNIISYGYQEVEDTAETILINAKLREDSLVVILRDRGIAFDPRNRLDQEQESCNLPAKERSIGGLGIYLAMSNIDHFEYEYKNGFNVNRF